MFPVLVFRNDWKYFMTLAMHWSCAFWTKFCKKYKCIETALQWDCSTCERNWWAPTNLPNPSLVRALSTLPIIPYFVKKNAATVDGNFWWILLVLQDYSRKLERNAVLWKNQFVASIQMLIKMFAYTLCFVIQ